MSKITIQYGASYAYSYDLPQNPSYIEPIQVETKDTLNQSNATALSYFRGKKWKFTLSFNAISQSMAQMLLTIKNYGDPFKIIFDSAFYFAGTYIVNWNSNFSFTYITPSTDSQVSGEIVFEEV